MIKRIKVPRVLAQLGFSIVALVGARADTLTLKPSAMGTVVVARHYYGMINQLWAGKLTPSVIDWDGQLSAWVYSGIAEFDLTSLPAGANVRQATISLRGIGGDFPCQLSQFIGDGKVSYADLSLGLVFATTLHGGAGTWQADSSLFVAEAVKNHKAFVGYRVNCPQFQVAKFSTALADAPTLTLTYTKS